MAQAAKQEGIEYNPDGTITLTIDGTVRHLRRPKLKEFRHWADELRELSTQTNDEIVRIRELLAESESASEEERAQIDKEAAEAATRRLEYTTPWTAGVVAQFSDKPLPEEADEWPSWLALDVSIPAQIMAHWRTVPLASSSK